MRLFEFSRHRRRRGFGLHRTKLLFSPTQKACFFFCCVRASRTCIYNEMNTFVRWHICNEEFATDNLMLNIISQKQKKKQQISIHATVHSTLCNCRWFGDIFPPDIVNTCFRTYHPLTETSEPVNAPRTSTEICKHKIIFALIIICYYWGCTFLSLYLYLHMTLSLLVRTICTFAIFLYLCWRIRACVSPYIRLVIHNTTVSLCRKSFLAYVCTL